MLHISDTPIEKTLDKLLDIPSLYERIWQIILLRLSSEVDQVCTKSKPSILRTKIETLKPESFFHDLVLEMHQRCPKVLDFLLMWTCPIHLTVSRASQVLPAMYAIGMYARNNELGAFQKAMAAACIRFNAGNGLMGVMHTVGITIPERSKLPLLDRIGSVNGKEVVSLLNNGKTIKVTVDNIDGRIKANQVRLGSSNTDYHYTHWTIIIDRYQPRDLKGLSTEPKVVPADGPNPDTFYLSKKEHASLRKFYTWFLMRELVEEALSTFSAAVPAVLDHEYRKVVDRPTEEFPMFVMSLRQLLQYLLVATS